MEKVHLIIWGVVLVIMVIAEIASVQFISIWFAAGSLAAFISAFFLPFEGQLAVFLAVSILLLLLTRPIFKKFSYTARHATNADMDVGKKAVVIEEINTVLGTGRVTLNGVDWLAVSADSSIVPKGSTVIVKEVEGAKFIVMPENTPEHIIQQN